MKGKALEGVRVLEYCSAVSGPYCTKLMADMGAEVIKVEPPESGDVARSVGPFLDDVPHPEKSGLFLYLNSNKRGITLNLATPRGREIFAELAKDVDVLVEDRPPGEMENFGLGYDDLKKRNPGLIMASVTPFGRSGPFKDYKAYQLNVSHVSGQGYLLPLPSPNLDRPPVKVGGHASDYDPGLVAVLPVMAALYSKGVTGQGQFIEVSKQEALISMQRVETVTFANDDIVITRSGRMKGQMPGGIMPCKDGYVVSVTPQDHQWQALMNLMENPEWSKREWCKDAEARSQHAGEITELIVAWMKQHTKEEIFRRGQALSCPIAPLHSAEDVVNSEQFRERGFFVEIDHPELGRLLFPTSAYRFSKSPWALEHPAPLLGQHNQELYCGRLGYSTEEVAELEEAGVI